MIFNDNYDDCDMILQLDDNMLMSLELLPSLITCIF